MPFGSFAMGLLKHLRSRSRLKSRDERNNNDYGYYGANNGAHLFVQRYTGPDRTPKLPDNVLRNIFLELCPHAGDGTYEPSETPLVGEGCMLCDLRDLANCQLVKRDWVRIVRELLYTNIRIDAVHYCELEEVLTEKRKHKKFLDRNGDPPDVPAVRLNLLARTLRSSLDLAHKVHVLKLPYMTRETCKADLTRAVSVCRNLRYVDLPDGFYQGDASCHPLRSELMARCPDIRRMRYSRGGEGLLELLMGVQHPMGHWQMLEQIEMSGLRVDPAMIRRALSSENLPYLQNLRLDGLPALTDALFGRASSLPDFPAISTLTIINAPHLTAIGLLNYLSQLHPPNTLTSLTLTDTGVATADLHAILAHAPRLARLGVTATVTQPLYSLDQYSPNAQAPPTHLASTALVALHLELTSSRSYLSDAPTAALEPPAASHYAYLAASLTSGSLPSLRALYVRDPRFSEHLALAAPLPAPGFSGFQDANPITGLPRSLAVYTKGLDELDWVYTPIESDHHSSPTTSPSRGRPSSTANRPVSTFSTWSAAGGGGAGDRSSVMSGFGAFGAAAATGHGGHGHGVGSGGFGNEAASRRSVVMSNGFGGFLAVPDPHDQSNARPSSPSSPGLKPPPGFGGFGGFGGNARPGSAGGLGVGGGGGWGEGEKKGGFFSRHQKGGSWAGVPAGMGPGGIGAGAGGEKGGGFFSRHEKRGSKHDLWR